MSELSEEAIKVLGWVNRMAEKYGDFIHDSSGNELSWGEALCRECYGADFYTYMANNSITMPGKAELERALAWEEGDIPDWAVYSDKPVEKFSHYTIEDKESD